MHAEKKQWETLQTKMPSGDMWASPGKRNGYLRRSVLRALAHKIGDRMLPDDMERAGTFVDTSPPTETKLWDEVASVEISLAIRQWRKGAGSSKETEDSEDSEED